MKGLNPDQRYLVEEFYDDYREGTLSRRTFIRRLAFRRLPCDCTVLDSPILWISVPTIK